MKKILFFISALLILSESFAQTPIRLGLNFPFRNPELTSIDNYMNHISGSGAQIFRQMTYADLIWKQVEATNNNWQFAYADSVFFNYPQFDFVANLYCFSISQNDTNNLGYQVPWRACDNAPVCGWHYDLDSVDTKDYLSTCINRYAANVKYWELGNESENGTYPLGIPNAAFIDFVKHNYQWIKNINPQLKVLLPGTLGTYGVPFQSKYNWYKNMFASGIGNYFDVFSFHDYNAWWTTPVHIDSIMAIRNFYGLQSKELWITESSVSSINDSISPAYVSTDEQAADVWRRTVIAWAKGINVFIWHGCWSSGMPSEWAEFGLLDFTGKKKKSYHAFKLLSEKILNFNAVQSVSMGTAVDDNNSTIGGNGVWVVKFVVNGQNKYVMWSRDNQSFQLSPSADTRYVITHVVPSTISANGETVTFEIDSVDVQAGLSHSFNLSVLPVLVEEQNCSSIQTTSSKNTVEFFPNPADNTLTITNIDHKTVVSLFDMKGKLVLEKETDKNITLDISQIPQGLYTLVFQTGNGKTINKISIAK